MDEPKSRAKWLTAYGPVLGLVALAPAAATSGQDITAGGGVSITGRVVDAVTRSPLEGVAVDIAELDLALRTDSAGQFEIHRIPVGTYELSLSLDGYQQASGSFAVVRNGSFVTTLTPLGVPAETLRGRVVGRIMDAESGRSLVGAEVRLPDLSLRAVAEADGRFTLADIPPGRHPVEFSYLGYASVHDTITVEPERTSDVRVQLAVDAIDLEPIEVTVERRQIALETAGFYERRAEGWGRFLDLEDIEERNPSEMTDLFSGMNGVTLVGDSGQPLERYVVLRGGRSEVCGGAPCFCFPTVVIDGAVVHRAGPEPARIDHLIDSGAIAGIEVYPSSNGVPIRYAGTGSSCGVILVWTRR